MDNKMINISKLTSEAVEDAIKKESYKSKYYTLLKNTVFTVIVIFAFSVLIATLIMPVFEIKGDAMNPTYKDKDIVVAFNTKKLNNQDIIAFYYGNKILVKRVVAKEGQWVNIKDNKVYVDSKVIELNEEEIDRGDITYPYQVPSGGIFVLSDNKQDLQDSRNSQIGCVKKEDILGKVLFKLWELK